jgi:hypothetical protein
MKGGICLFGFLDLWEAKLRPYRGRADLAASSESFAKSYYHHPSSDSRPMSDDRYILDQLDLSFWKSLNEDEVHDTDATSGVVSQGGPTVGSWAEFHIAQTAFLDPLVDFPSAHIVQSPQSLVLVQG